MTNNSSESEHYRRALEAEPALRVIEQVVNSICNDVLPSNEAWANLVAPLTTPYLGVSRGYGVKNADNVSRADRTLGEELEDLTADLEDLSSQSKAKESVDKYRLPAMNSTEEWLRSAEAWDAVTHVWIHRMQDVASSTARR
ncbi:hypothetical protein [Arthrobacter sp. B0490]|uniref:hypothetical protein n=1 Tax=Arthrobacter sp. B0490 TaxID=2058891 RepID=UPI000CE38800|nr:hypothetical protein [Arthrobacter sp. B0490]